MKKPGQAGLMQFTQAGALQRQDGATSGLA